MRISLQDVWPVLVVFVGVAFLWFFATAQPLTYDDSGLTDEDMYGC